MKHHYGLFKVRMSCPDCGMILEDWEIPVAAGKSEVDGKWQPGVPFDCRRCKAHYTGADFWQDFYDKTSRQRDEERFTNEP